MKRQLNYTSPQVSIHNEQRSSVQEPVSSSSQQKNTLRLTMPPTRFVAARGSQVPPRQLVGRVMSTPIPHFANGGDDDSSLLFPQHSRTAITSHSNTLQYRTSPIKRTGVLLPMSRTGSFDENSRPPSQVDVVNIRHTVRSTSDNGKMSSSPTSSSSSSPSSTPKISSSSSTTSSTASVSDDDNDESLLVTHATTTTANTRTQKRLHRSLSSDDYYTNSHNTVNTDDINNDDHVHWMTSTLVSSSHNSSSPPQELKHTSCVRKRPSPRCTPNNDPNSIDGDHSYDHANNMLHQWSSPPSSLVLPQQQLSVVQNSGGGSTPLSSSSNTTTTATSSLRSTMHQNKSGSFRRRKGMKGSTLRKSLLRKKSLVFLRYMYLQRYFSTKRRTVFVLYSIAILLSLLFIVSFSLSFLSSHRSTITKLFSFSSLSSPEAPTGTKNGSMIPKPWKMVPERRQQSKTDSTSTSSNDSSNDFPQPTMQQQQNRPQQGKGTSSTNVIHTLRGRYKKHNIISQKDTMKKDNEQKKPFKWFGFSHLLLPPKNSTARQVTQPHAATATDVANSTFAATLRGGVLHSIMVNATSTSSSNSLGSPIVVTGKVYNFRRFTNFAPQCSSNDISVNDIDFTLATQLSYNRLWMMEHHCLRWTQAMSLAIYIGNNNQTESSITSESIRHEMIQMGCSDQQDISVQVLSGYSDEEYPVNILRNMALSKVQTTHVVYVDVDFWVSIDLYTILNQHRELLLSNTKLALVIPAFQLSRQCKEWHDCREMNIPKMPHTKDELVDLMVDHQANAFDPSNRGGHGSTRYKEWLLQLEDELVPIDCVKSNRYEPYLVFRLCNDLPPFQESFTGYGKNKMTWMMQLRRTGYQLMQLGGAFAVHYPHLDSTARMHWNGGVDGSQLPKPHDTTVDLSKFKRGQIDETFVAFRHWLATSVPDNSVMPMCSDAQDDDQRLWIAPDKVMKVKA